MKVLSAHAVSVDGYIGGRTPDGVEEFGRGSGDAIAAAREAAGDKVVR
ncbi:hypothetical protein [Phytohabitans aurantiacus]|jgi:hypothetical protein|uniref:Bacterial bifunctional deaminase-reductase C-terminal domain-containing protein n=1 Tax=Phytohabitans aurantiacus TaxID=3016789 RepID=A0ABQ5R523_9ACTN|nr:hypothetical protein [Phytohabitans aurantiacus]GLI01495.1 hypothetical protein Pa4123_67710 [Phytohabitans aurantiacus]